MLHSVQKQHTEDDPGYRTVVKNLETLCFFLCLFVKCVWGHALLCLEVLTVLALPVCVSHPKQSVGAVHSGALKSAEPALIQISTCK